MCSYCVGIGTIKQQLFENILFSFGNGNLSRGLIFLYTQNTPHTLVHYLCSYYTEQTHIIGDVGICSHSQQPFDQGKVAHLTGEYERSFTILWDGETVDPTI